MKTTKNINKTIFWGILILLIIFTLAGQAVAQADAVAPAVALAQAGSST